MATVEEIRENIVCIGYYNGMAIFQDELRNVFFKEEAAEFFELGEPTIKNGLTNITELSADEQNNIIDDLL